MIYAIIFASDDDIESQTGKIRLLFGEMGGSRRVKLF
jgi:hypothetical protein